MPKVLIYINGTVSSSDFYYYHGRRRSAEDYSADDQMSEDEHIPPPRASRVASPSQIACMKKSPTKTDPSVIPEHASVGELRTIAKNRGVKYTSRMTKKQLHDALGVKPSEAGFIFKNKETGEELRFSSMNKASKELKVNPGSISYYIGKDMTIGQSRYSVTKL